MDSLTKMKLPFPLRVWGVCMCVMSLGYCSDQFILGGPDMVLEGWYWGRIIVIGCLVSSGIMVGLSLLASLLDGEERKEK